MAIAAASWKPASSKKKQTRSKSSDVSELLQSQVQVSCKLVIRQRQILYDFVWGGGARYGYDELSLHK